MSRTLWLTLGLLACSGDKDAESEDSGGVHQVDTADFGDTAGGSEPGDTGDGEGDGSTVTVIPEGDADGLIVGVAQFWIEKEGVVSGPLLGSGIVQDGSANLELPELEESDLYDDGSGALTGTFVAFLRRDENSDGSPGEDEPILGVSEVWLFYIAGELSADNEAFGLQLGWNAIWFDIQGGGSPVLHDLGAFPVEQNLVAVESIGFSGDSDVSDTPADPIRVTALPIDVELTDDTWSSLVFDEQLSSTWEIEITGRPDDSHFVEDEDTLPSALELAIVYVDVDESESLSGGDETLYGVCSGEKPLLLMWVDELSDLDDAIAAPLVGLSIGWSGWAVDVAGGTPPDRLDEKQLTQLSAEASCSLE